MNSTGSPIENILAGQALLGDWPAVDGCFGDNQISGGSAAALTTVSPAPTLAWERQTIVGGLVGGGVVTAATFALAKEPLGAAIVGAGQVQKIFVRRPTSAASTTVRRASAQRSALTTCLELLAARRGLLTSQQASALARQLTSLLDNSEELDANGVTVSPTSLDGLVEFLANHRPDIHPNISVNRDGRFAASWWRGKRAKITLVFDREGGDWTAVDLEAKPTLRQTGAFVIDSLHSIEHPFASWIKA